MGSEHPALAPRRAAGSKGDAWVVSLPGAPAPGHATLAFDTGMDSATVVIGGVDGAPARMHPGHDLAVVVTSGAGELHHGPSADRLAVERYVAPCTLVIPSGAWHLIAPDVGAPPAVAFFTRPGTVIDPFSVVGPRAEPGVVRLDVLPIAPVEMVPARVVQVAPARSTGSAGTSDVLGPARPARVMPYDQPVDGYTLPLDTGSDSLFVMASRSRSWDRAPVDVPVHRHDREDELIVLSGGEGWLLNGPTPESVVRTAFRGPCVLVMPSGNFHRVVRTDDEVVDAILVYAHRRAVTGSWEAIEGEMRT